MSSQDELPPKSVVFSDKNNIIEIESDNNGRIRQGRRPSNLYVTDPIGPYPLTTTVIPGQPQFGSLEPSSHVAVDYVPKRNKRYRIRNEETYDPYYVKRMIIPPPDIVIREDPFSEQEYVGYNNDYDLALHALLHMQNEESRSSQSQTKKRKRSRSPSRGGSRKKFRISQTPNKNIE